jgi:hypothetical protein
MGFSSGAESVYSSVSDVLETNPNYRLSWITNGESDYRYGSKTEFISSTIYQKFTHRSL